MPGSADALIIPYYNEIESVWRIEDQCVPVGDGESVPAALGDQTYLIL